MSASGRPRLAAVFAHPDDDAYTIGGLLARYAGRIDVTIVLCTSGGSGPIWEPVATRETLGQVREGEQAAWREALGLHDARVEFLRYPDGGLSDVPWDELVGRVEAILREAAPHVVVTFGPDGMTHHPDHIRAGEAAGEAFERIRSSPGEAPGSFARLFHVALRSSTMAGFYLAIKERHLPFGDEQTLFNPTGVPDERIAVDVDVSDVYERKLAAIRVHRSQIGELDRIPRDLQPLWLAHECFVQAWPAWDPETPPMAEPFEGLVI